MPPNSMHDHNDNFDIDLCHSDSFDEKTFRLELQVADPERCTFAHDVMHLLERLAQMRATNENTSLDDAREHLFEFDYLVADMHGSNEGLALLAEQVNVAFDKLSELRCTRRHLLPMPKWMRRSTASNTNTSGGSRAV